MLVEILLAILIGIICGIFTGLLPGIHINLVSVWLIAAAPLLLTYFPAIAVASLIVAMGITQTLFDPIPAIFLGAPSDNTALIALPGHRMLARGHGLDAVKLIMIGAFASLVFMVLLSPLIYIIIRFGYPLAELAMGPLLIAFIIYFILKNPTWNSRIWSMIVMALSGVLGLVVLNSPVFKEPMFPMLTGFFGISMLLRSLASGSSFPIQQSGTIVKFPASFLIRPIFGAGIGGLITGIFPGIGASHATIFGRVLLGKLTTREYLILNGGVSLVNFFASLFALHLIGKPRNGAVLALQSFIPKLGYLHLISLIMVALIAGGLGFYLSMKVADVYSKMFNKIDYMKISIAVIALLTLFTIAFSGFLGLAVLAIATAIGFIPGSARVGMSNCMGAILVPVAAYFF